MSWTDVIVIHGRGDVQLQSMGEKIHSLSPVSVNIFLRIVTKQAIELPTTAGDQETS